MSTKCYHRKYQAYAMEGKDDDVDDGGGDNNNDEKTTDSQLGVSADCSSLIHTHILNMRVECLYILRSNARVSLSVCASLVLSPFLDSSVLRTVILFHRVVKIYTCTFHMLIWMWMLTVGSPVSVCVCVCVNECVCIATGIYEWNRLRVCSVCYTCRT